MKKHVFVASIVAIFGLSPIAAMAQDHAIPAESAHSVQKLESPSTGKMTQGRSASTTGSAQTYNKMTTDRTSSTVGTTKGDATELSK